MVSVLRSVQESALGDEITTALRERGIEASPVESDLGPSGDVVVALLSPHLAEDLGGVDAANAVLGTAEDRLIPVDVHGDSDLAKHLSNISLHRLGVAKTADAIALIVASGSSQDLRAWRRLADSATEWSLSGEPDSSLMNPGDTGDADALLKRPVSGIDDMAGAVRKYTTASRRHNSRRSRRAVLIVATVCAVLTASTGFAVVQTLLANRAADTARLSADQSAATRLAGEAIDLVGRDPDLPWLLAQAALRKDPTSPEAIAAGYTVVDGLVPHKTISLRQPGSGLSVAKNGVAVVSYLERGYDVIDTASSKLLSGGEDTLGTEAAISPAGEYVAFARHDGSIAVRRTADGTDVALPELPHAAIHATFASDDELLVGTTSGVFTTRLSSAQWRQMPGSSNDRVRSIYVVIGRPYIRVTYADIIDLIDTDRGEVVERRERDRVTAALVNPRTGESVTATRTQVIIESADDPPEVLSAGPTSIDIAPSGDVLIGQFNGQLAVVPRIGRPHRLTLLAHTGQIQGIGATEDGKWLTVGTDSQLRVWDPTTQLESYTEKIGVHTDSMGSSSHISGYAESKRNMLGHQPGSANMVMSVPGSGQNAYVDRQSLDVLGSGFLGVGPGLILRPAARDGYGVVVRPAGKESSVGSYANEIGEVFTFTVPDHFDTRVANANISSNGSAVVVATDSDIGAWVHTDGQVRPTVRHLAAPDHPVLTNIDNDGTAVAIGASGTAHYADGRDELLITPESPVVAASVTGGGAPILVTQDGQVWTKSGNKYDSRLSVGRGFGAFATSISADGTLLAVIGTDSTSILDLSHSRQIALVQRNFRGLVHDVIFDDDGQGFSYIREDASVGHRSLSPPDQLGILLDSMAPREVTDEEQRTVIDVGSRAR